MCQNDTKYIVDTIVVIGYINNRKRLEIGIMNNKDIVEVGKKTRFSKDNQPAIRGRKPSRLRKFLKENNLDSRDIQLLAGNLMYKSRAELTAIAKDPKLPILVSGCAAALLKDMSKGTTNSLQWLIDRAFGKALESVHLSGDIGLYKSKEDRAKRIDDLLKKREEKT